MTGYRIDVICNRISITVKDDDDELLTLEMNSHEAQDLIGALLEAAIMVASGASNLETGAELIAAVNG
jgi:hypothetical protein